MNELTLKLQSAEVLVQKALADSDSTRAKETAASPAELTALLKAREDEVKKYRCLAAEMEKKVSGCNAHLAAAFVWQSREMTGRVLISL